MNRTIQQFVSSWCRHDGSNCQPLGIGSSSSLPEATFPWPGARSSGGRKGCLWIASDTLLARKAAGVWGTQCWSQDGGHHLSQVLPFPVGTRFSSHTSVKFIRKVNARNIKFQVLFCPSHHQPLPHSRCLAIVCRVCLFLRKSGEPLWQRGAYAICPALGFPHRLFGMIRSALRSPSGTGRQPEPCPRELPACQGLTWVPGKGRASNQGSQSGIMG